MKLKLTILSKNKSLQKHVKQLTKNSTILNDLIVEIFSLCGIDHFTNSVRIYLIHKRNNQEMFAWFSWTPQKSFITVEFNNLDKIDDKFLILVLAHELFHLILRKNKNLIRKIIKYIKPNQLIFQKIKEERLLPRIILEELIVSSFIPEGCLSKKYFNMPIKKISKFLYDDLIDWRRYVAYKMQKSAQTYLKNERIIDDKYIKEIVMLVRKKK
ncbi:MAG: hypothetical protein Q8N88_02785 [Nanoarchaeota archaeon]|nr:hypothetical protein [Nanoarchaeota archaeon]